MQKKGKDPIVEELKAIKKLLILALYAKDIPSGEIDKAVGMGAANIRATFSKRNLKRKGEKEDSGM
jgi:hypothetical protein